MFPFPAEPPVFLDGQADIEIPRVTSPEPPLSLAREADLHPVVHAGRDVHGNFFLLRDPSPSLTFRTGVRDLLPGPVAAGASSGKGEKPSGMENLPSPAAARATFHSVPRFRTGAFARLARQVPHHIDLPLAAEDGLLERNPHVGLKILARNRPGAAPTGRRSEPEKRVEEIPEARKDVLDPGKTVEPPPLEPGVAELVVNPAPLGVAEDLVRLGRLFEPLFGFVVPGV